MSQPIRQGECVSSVAARNGMLWETIWDAPENEPLRESGRHPNLLLPGDELFVPEPELGSESVSTGQRHRIVVRGAVVALHIQLVAHLEPLANEPWVIEFPGGQREGQSDGEGRLEVELPATLDRVILLLPDRRQRFGLRLGALDPIETSSGALGRLRNLGLASADQIGEHVDEALLGYQRLAEIDETAELDDATIDALRGEYGI